MGLKEKIEIKNLSEHNIQNVSLTVEKRKLTVFTGVSGSGKSTLVFDAIGTEAQRQMNETYPTFIRAKLPQKARPKVDAIDNLTPVVIIDQTSLGGNVRSTVGTISDLYTSLRLLYARIGFPLLESASCFSFNDPKGMCRTCSGLGNITDIDMDLLLDKRKSLNEGAILDSSYAIGSWYWKVYVESGLFDNNKRIDQYTNEEYNLLLYGSTEKVGDRKHPKVEGLYNKFSKSYLNRDVSQLSKSTQEKSKKILSTVECPACKGMRLNEAAIASKILDYSIADMASMEISELHEVISSIKNNNVSSLISDLSGQLQKLIDIGLPYISLNRQTSTLSGGEAQRVKLVKHLGSTLTDMTYIFDEPSTGMHPRDVSKINKLLLELRDKGNTILVIEHDKDVISIADEIIDVGPKAGRFGGQIVFQGSYEALLESGTLTGDFMKQVVGIKKNVRKANGVLPIVDAATHNLKHLSVNIPLGILVAVTGVAGSGKSSLITDCLYNANQDKISRIDQKPITASSRSTAATFLNFFDPIRKLFADETKQDPALFSFNSKGACEICGGKGVIVTELVFMDPVITTCETCKGSRYSSEAIKHQVKGHSIVDVLNLTVDEALHFFENQKIISKLETLKEVGLNYLSLGQPLSTLSGGERQRVKLAQKIKQKNSVIILDEPTTGLHLSDVRKLMKLLNKLVDNGNSIIVIEHNLEVVKQADWIIDIGPDGGKFGGHLVFEGVPYDMFENAQTITAECLRRSVQEENKYLY
ncbi:excinuclease ABC subunit UvrA [Enterococcus sp. JM4C]|uniref:ATP-binding cassette domain-containing protein n=1 Tax=Candidatus Enterococcus huntleyi TaxID=1857217 RepID=UPI001F204D98